MSKNFVDKSLPAGTGRFVKAVFQRGPFIKHPAMAVRAWGKYLPDCQEDIMSCVNTVTATYGAFHTVLLTVIHRKFFKNKIIQNGPDAIRTHDRPVMSRAL